MGVGVGGRTKGGTELAEMKGWIEVPPNCQDRSELGLCSTPFPSLTSACGGWAMGMGLFEGEFLGMARHMAGSGSQTAKQRAGSSLS